MIASQRGAVARQTRLHVSALARPAGPLKARSVLGKGAGPSVATANVAAFPAVSTGDFPRNAVRAATSHTTRRE